MCSTDRMHEIVGHNNQNIILFIWPNAQNIVFGKAYSHSTWKTKAQMR